MDIADLWPPFALRVTCGPLVLRPLRDTDFPEVLAVAHAGIHAPDAAAVLLPMDGRRRGPTSSGRSCSTTGECGPSSPREVGARPRRVDQGRFVGVQGVSTQDFPVTRTGETGSWLGREFHGQGIGTLMRQAICVLCFDHLGFEEVTSGAFTDNPASLGVSRKVGYRRTASVRLGPQGRAGHQPPARAGAGRPGAAALRRRGRGRRRLPRAGRVVRRARRRASSARPAPAGVRRAAGPRRRRTPSAARPRARGPPPQTRRPAPHPAAGPAARR